jgi:phenol 2-monooxygenase (NADPH)
MKTDMPDARIGVAGIESPTHGNILWIALDHGSTRISFTLQPDKLAKYNDKPSGEDAKNEAIEAMLPFKLENPQNGLVDMLQVRRHFYNRSLGLVK